MRLLKDNRPHDVIYYSDIVECLYEASCISRDELIMFYVNPRGFAKGLELTLGRGTLLDADRLMAYSILRKAPDIAPPVDLEASSFSAFIQAETKCRMINKRFEHLDLATSEFGPVLMLARRKIEGLFKGFGFASALSECRHGPGTTYSINDTVAGIDTKYDEERLSVTFGAYNLAKVVCGTPGWLTARGVDAWGPVSLLRHQFNIVRGDRISFQAKDATALRVCSTGPTACVYMQLGVGTDMRRRLKKYWGVDLKRGSATNSDMARFASRRETIATIDLSNASGSIARNFVWCVLPTFVTDLTDLLRSEEYEYKGKWTKYEQYSGMGNGFTFPLETIIFHALVESCCEVQGIPVGWNCTYGDDIICPSECVPYLVRVFDFCGFEMNQSKSYVSGSFRESCGGNFVNGVDIRPPRWHGFDNDDETRVIRRGTDAHPVEIAKLAHTLMLWEDRVGRVGMFNKCLKELYKRYVQLSLALNERVVFCALTDPLGYGFPSVPVDGIEPPRKWRWEFIPAKREGRDRAVLCSVLERGYTPIRNFTRDLNTPVGKCVKLDRLIVYYTSECDSAHVLKWLLNKAFSFGKVEVTRRKLGKFKLRHTRF